LIKKKNAGVEDKALESAEKLHALEVQAKDEKIKHLENELRIKVELLHQKNDLKE
jgi:hypothetical protein